MQPEEIIRLKGRQHKADVALIRQLERELAAMTRDRNEWRDIVQASAQMRETVVGALRQVMNEYREHDLAYFRREEQKYRERQAYTRRDVTRRGP